MRETFISTRVLAVLLLCCCPEGRVYGCSGDFSATCSNEQLVGSSSLQALCGDGQGGFGTTSLDLDQHITNNDGLLQCNSGGGAFSQSCQSESLDDYNTLSADCFDISGNLIHSSLNLDNCVQNSNGNLAWACV